MSLRHTTFYVAILKGYHCNTLHVTKVMGFTLILIFSLIKWVGAPILVCAIYSITGTAWQKFDILNYFVFDFDEVSLKREVKLTVIIVLCEDHSCITANGTRSHLDFSNAPFALWNSTDSAKICTRRTQDYSVLTLSTLGKIFSRRTISLK